jgi:hypothetical protein
MASLTLFQEPRFLNPMGRMCSNRRFDNAPGTSARTAAASSTAFLIALRSSEPPQSVEGSVRW